MTAVALPRSRLDELALPERFAWATGIEDTFITDPWPATGRTLDEYELTGHYRRWRGDLGRMRELGVGTARYGIPWHRVNPAAGVWRWGWADRPLERMLELGIDPIVDLVHYGTPAWIEGGYLHPDFPERMAEYAARVADRFKGRVRWYTPLNEPRIAAWYCGMLGWWPPYRRGWRGFIAILVAICRGIAATVRALRQVDREIVAVHVDATDLYEAAAPAVAADAARRQRIVYLALDLLTGAVAPRHPLYGWLRTLGMEERALSALEETPIDLDVVGINLYPMFTRKRVLATPFGPRVRMLYAASSLIDELARRYHRRYRRPLMITETASLGSVRRRAAWLRDSTAAVRRVRARGIPLIGYTWWPMFSLVAWSYRQRTHAVDRYFLRMGLWDLDSKDLRRVRTPLVDGYAAIVADGARTVGAVGPRTHGGPRVRSAVAEVR